jgi:hypothetical protein
VREGGSERRFREAEHRVGPAFPPSAGQPLATALHEASSDA